jgi:hypothetical protein
MHPEGLTGRTSHKRLDAVCSLPLKQTTLAHGGCAMTTIELYPDDVHNQRTIRRGDRSACFNREGGDDDLVVLGGGPGDLTAATTRGRGPVQRGMGR